MNKLEAMQVFIEVAKQKSFVAASEQLNLSAPAVTRSIAAFEENLGVKLFHRTTRHVRLTEAGTRFFSDAKRILEAIETAEANAAGTYSTPKGMLTITAPILFGEKYIIPIVTEFLEQYPQMSVQTVFSDRVVGLVEEEFDIAIRIGHLKDANFYANKVGEVRRIVCGSPRYFAQYGVPHQPSELSNHSIIFSSTYETIPTWHFVNKEKNEAIKLSPRLQCNQNGAAIRAAIDGHGVTKLMSYQIGEALENGELQSVLGEYEEPPLPINILHLEGPHMTAKVHAFFSLAVARLQANPLI